ncbi:hypothetical protein [Candidatus Nitrosocosmicus hydrocola]|uniref:hypothetical protein n=1 Tax=Candidatus Nitrosocosmicus hydrocola TaxID=1826872 RepID=UPI0011E5C833|nr:hypothetical protein [Candidatus Nitrosocosmicus hydrocola]
MSDIINNAVVEDVMTKKFLSRLYVKSNKQANVTGMKPIELWEEMGYNAFDESVISMIIKKLIQNNIAEKYIRLDQTSGLVYLTDIGKEWADTHYDKYY